MFIRTQKIDPPTKDAKWKNVQAVMRSNGYSRDALIETLHAVQKEFGYLDDASLRYVAASLRVPLSKVYGVSTFYHLFHLEPFGRHTCVICTGTACYLKGIPQLLDKIKELYGLAPGESAPDGWLTLGDTRCVGACGVAPVAVFDDETVGKVSPESILGKLEEWSHHD